MIYFNLLISGIESFLYAYFIGNYFKLRFKNLYITVMSIIQLILLTYAIFIGNSGPWLSFSIIGLMIISLIIWNKKIIFDYIYIVLLYNTIIIIAALIGILINSTLISFNLNSKITVIIGSVIAKIIQTIITVYFVKSKLDLSTTFSFKEWGNLIMLDVFILTGLILITYIILTGNYSNVSFYIMLVIIFLIAIFYRLSVIKINQLNEQKTQYQRANDLLKYNSEKLAIMNQVRQEIETTDHRIFYMLFQMESYLKNNEIDKLRLLLEKYRETIIKYKLVANTGNVIFDCLYSLKINDLIINGQNVDNSIFLTKKEEYNNIEFINTVTELFDYFKEAKTLMISLNEVGSFLTMKIIYRDGIIDKEDLINYLETKLSEKNYNTTDIETKGLRITINMEKYKNGLHN